METVHHKEGQALTNKRPSTVKVVAHSQHLRDRDPSTYHITNSSWVRGLCLLSFINSFVHTLISHNMVNQIPYFRAAYPTIRKKL